MDAVFPLAEMRYDRGIAPALLLFADDAPARSHLAALIEAGGGRIAAELPLGAAPARLGEAGAAVAGAVIDLRGAAPAALDALVAAPAAMAAMPLLAVIDVALIDAASAWLGRPDVTLLVAPDDADIVAELALLVAPRAARLGEEGEAARGRHLARLSDEAGRIARTLATMAGEAQLPPAAPVAAPGAGAPGAELRTALEAGHMILRLRRLRARHLDPALFADPAWDMLLDLFVADAEDRAVAVSSLCIAAAVPPTTALRWIAALGDRGMISRRPDPADGRRAFVSLAPAAHGAMAAYLAAAAHAMGMAQ